jgi:hypothetical protein
MVPVVQVIAAMGVVNLTANIKRRMGRHPALLE